MGARRLGPGLAVLLLAGCTGSLVSQDEVQDLRILGMRSDPPEQVVAFDGGAPPSIAAITTTALVADPNGAGRSLHGVFTTCAAVDLGTEQCSPTSVDYAVIGEVDVVPDGGPSAELSATFTPSLQLLTDALANDLQRGFGYLPLPVQLTITSGGETAVGVKVEFFTQPLGNPTHVNPTIPLIELEGAPWDAGATPPLPAIDGGLLVDPVTPVALEESYLVPAYAGGTIAFTEDWSYNFYCTAGQFNAPSSGGVGQGVRGGQVQTTTVSWERNNGATHALPGTLVHFWIVVSDGHGGQAWTERLGLPE